MAKRKKSNLDKFYTKENVVDICLNCLDLDKFDIIIEPSAGAGAFSNKLDYNKCIALDIQPESNNIIQQDYLTFDIRNYQTNHKKILVVGNPPFGNNSSMVFKFFKKSIFADTIAFILPKSFKKTSFQDRIPLNYHLIKQIELPENSFTLNNDDYNVPCVFQVWNKKQEYRQKTPILKALSFSFVKKNENPDISIRRVGVNAGTLSFFNDTNKSSQSHYFIKSNNIGNFINKFNKIQWLHDNTAGCNSISKQEIIKYIDYKEEK
jgi:hypothetical protein